MRQNQSRGIISLIFGALLFSLWGVFPRLIGMDFGIFFQVLARELIILLILLPFFLWRREWLKIGRKDYPWFLGMSLSGFFSVVTAFVAFNNLGVGTTFFVFYSSSTLAGYFLGRWLFQERLTPVKIISLFICLAGLLVIFSFSPAGDNLFYLLLALLSGLGGAGWNIFSKKVSSKYSLLQVLITDSLIYFVLGTVSIIIFSEPVFWPTLSGPWLATLLFSFSILGGAFLTINGFRHLSAQNGTLLMLLEPVFGVVFGWLVFAEVLSYSSLIGGALIIFGAALPNIIIRRENKLSEA